MIMKGCRRIRIVLKENREQQKARNDIMLFQRNIVTGFIICAVVKLSHVAYEVLTRLRVRYFYTNRVAAKL